MNFESTPITCTSSFRAVASMSDSDSDTVTAFTAPISHTGFYIESGWVWLDELERPRGSRRASRKHKFQPGIYSQGILSNMAAFCFCICSACMCLIHPRKLFKITICICSYVCLIFCFVHMCCHFYLPDDGSDEQHDLHNDAVALHNRNVKHARTASRVLSICTCACSCGKSRHHTGHDEASASKRRRAAGTRDDPIPIADE